MKHVQINRDTALKLAKDVIATLNQKPLRPYVDAMMTEGYKEAIAVSAVSGDKPDNFALFMAMCRTNGFLSKSETIDLCLKLVRKSELTPQAPVQDRLDCDQDPYLYTGTAVLRNHPGTRKQAELDELERMITSHALDSIRKKPVPGNFDYARLCEIHLRIFEEVYPFAGKTRIINMSKYEPVLNGGSVDYSRFKDIVHDATCHLKNMNKRDWSSLHDMSKPEFMQIFAEDIAELWRIHPFREGNTRTTMTFMIQFAREHGFTLDYNLFAGNPEFVRNGLVVATYNHPEHLTRILTDSRNAILDREPEKRDEFDNLNT